MNIEHLTITGPAAGLRFTIPAPSCNTSGSPTTAVPLSYYQLLARCETSEYGNDAATAYSVFQQALGRNATPAEIEQIAARRCQAILQNEGLSP